MTGQTAPHYWSTVKLCYLKDNIFWLLFLNHVQLYWPHPSHPDSCHVHHTAGWLTHTLHWYTHTRSQNMKGLLEKGQVYQSVTIPDFSPLEITQVRPFQFLVQWTSGKLHLNVILTENVALWEKLLEHVTPKYCRMLSIHVKVFILCTTCCRTKCFTVLGQ